MANKIKVYTSDVVKREVVKRSEKWEKHSEGVNQAGNKFYGTATFYQRTLADFTGRLEVHLDIDALIRDLAHKAFNASNRRTKRGPIEIRVVDMKQVSEDRITNPKPAEVA